MFFFTGKCFSVPSSEQPKTLSDIVGGMLYLFLYISFKAYYFYDLCNSLKNLIFLRSVKYLQTPRFLSDI